MAMESTCEEYQCPCHAILQQVAAAITPHMEHWARGNVARAQRQGQRAEGWPNIPLTNELIVAIMDTVAPLPPVPTHMLFVYHVNREDGTVHMVPMTPTLREERRKLLPCIHAAARCGARPDNVAGECGQQVPHWGLCDPGLPAVHTLCVACRRGINPYKVQP